MVLALGIGLLGVVGSASPKDNDDGHNNGDKGRSSTLTVLTKSRETKVVELGPRGPTHGDMRVVNAPLYDATGTNRIGRVDLFCVLTDPAEERAENAHRAECTVTTTLPGGEISAQGVSVLPELPELPATDVQAITGGTKKYAGVEGDVRLEPRGNKLIITFRFIG
jgi:hypothetical protein